MIDIKFIRENPDTFDAAMKSRGVKVYSEELLQIDATRRSALTDLQTLEAERNRVSKVIGECKRKGETTSKLEQKVRDLRPAIVKLESCISRLAETLQTKMAALPNIPRAEVRIGRDEIDNFAVSFWGSPKEFPFEVKAHWNLGLLDFERARHLAGARFVVMHGDVARLHRALGTFMLDMHTQAHGYKEVAVPLIVREEIAYGTGQLPKMLADMYRTNYDQWLIPTAEVPLTALYSNEILESDDLPLRLTALTPCFRQEAGAAGKDSRGMMRQHQFDKVELVSLTRPEDSSLELMRMRKSAEAVLQSLELPYRVLALCTGELGFSSAQTYDLEVWIPSQKTYREISSCSNCSDFQARRLGARFRESGTKGTQLLHTLNGSGVAVGRALIAILENFQREDGSVVIPRVLRPYMRFQKVLTPAERK